MDNVIHFPTTYQGKRDTSGMDSWSNVLAIGLGPDGEFHLCHDDNLTGERAVYLLECAKKLILDRIETINSRPPTPPRGA